MPRSYLAMVSPGPRGYAASLTGTTGLFCFPVHVRERVARFLSALRATLPCRLDSEEVRKWSDDNPQIKGPVACDVECEPGGQENKAVVRADND